MPNVTFSSPLLQRSVTVFTAGGDASSILSVAEENKIPLPRTCRDGECGVCVVDVLALSGKTMGSRLTDKEKARLAAVGKITPEEIRRAEINEIAPRYRLACQYVIGHEDILVKFTGRPGST